MEKKSQRAGDNSNRGVGDNLKNSFHPWPKEKSLYWVRKKNPKRDAKAIKEFKKKHSKCIICGKPAETHHIKTKGAGGSDKEENLWPLCFKHHILQRHILGKKRFMAKYHLLIQEWEEKQSKIGLGVKVSP